MYFFCENVMGISNKKIHNVNSVGITSGEGAGENKCLNIHMTSKSC
jgi:hypothetical protein